MNNETTSIRTIRKIAKRQHNLLTEINNLRLEKKEVNAQIIECEDALKEYPNTYPTIPKDTGDEEMNAQYFKDYTWYLDRIPKLKIELVQLQTRIDEYWTIYLELHTQLTQMIIQENLAVGALLPRTRPKPPTPRPRGRAYALAVDAQLSEAGGPNENPIHGGYSKKYRNLKNKSSKKYRKSKSRRR